MKPFIIGIAGGSGSGKSTLAEGLKAAFPGTVLTFHLDDYFRPADEVPVRAGMKNWDDPRALYYGKMAKDLALLKAGERVVINTKSPDLNPDFLRTGQRIPVEFAPKPLIVVEGFLTLHFPKIRKLLDFSIYLDAPFNVHISRRVHGKLHSFPEDYDRLVLQPMNDRYVSPSRVHADITLNAGSLTQKQVLKKTTDLLIPRIT
jgi:uridine kinase